MSYFKGARETKRINLPSDPNYWVELYIDQKWGEGKKYLRPGEDGDFNDSITVNASRFLASVIVDWNLDGPDGKKMPITEENIDLLDQIDGLALIKLTGNSTEVAEEKKSKKSS